MPGLHCVRLLAALLFPFLHRPPLGFTSVVSPSGPTLRALDIKDLKGLRMEKNASAVFFAQLFAFSW